MMNAFLMLYYQLGGNVLIINVSFFLVTALRFDTRQVESLTQHLSFIPSLFLLLLSLVSDYFILRTTQFTFLFLP